MSLQSAKEALQAKADSENNVITPVNPTTVAYPAWNTNNPTRKRILEMGQMIKDERKKLGWSQRKLGIESGYSQGTITRAEKNGWISLFAQFAIFDALGKKIQLIDK